MTIHAEASHLHRLLEEMQRGWRGRLNPTTSPRVLDYLWELLDLVLVMTVNPGLGGQALSRPCYPRSVSLPTDQGTGRRWSCRLTGSDKTAPG